MSEFSMDQEFAELAHSALHAKAPNLMSFVAGFQTISASEDNTRAIGMFGLDVGGRLFFVPVFFLKGVIKPLSIIFDYRGNQFMPFEREWISYVLKPNKNTLGSSQPDPRGGFSNFLAPSMDPTQASYGSQNNSTSGALSKSAEELKYPSIKELTFQKKAHRVASYLPAYISGSSLAEKKAFMNMLKHEKFAQVVDKKVGLELIKSALAKKLKEIKPGVEQDEEAATETGKVEIVSVLPRSINKAILDKVPQNSRAELMRKGYYIDDRRDSTAKVYSTQYKSQFKTPDKSGEYSSIMEDGTLERVLVLCDPHQLVDNQVSRKTLVVRPSDMAWTRKGAYEYMVSPVRRSEDVVERVLRSTVPAKAMVPGKKYILIDARLMCSDAFTVETTRTDSGNSVHYKVRPDENYEGVYLMVGLANAERFKRVGNEVIVPGSCVALELPMEKEVLKLGHVGDLSNRLMHTGLEPLVITNDGVEYELGDGQKVDRVGALRKLLIDKGIGKVVAEELLDKSASERVISVLIKQATPVSLNQATNSDQPWSTTSISTPQEQVGVSSIQPHTSYEDPYKDNHEGSGMDMLPTLPLAAAQFDTDIFDSAIIANLAESVDPSSDILEYVPDLEIALDKLGRMLFLLWWKYDHFRSMYSPAELTTMEADLKLLLSKLGDVTLRFKKRAASAARD